MSNDPELPGQLPVPSLTRSVEEFPFWTQMNADFQDFICGNLRKSVSYLTRLNPQPGPPNNPDHTFTNLRALPERARIPAGRSTSVRLTMIIKNFCLIFEFIFI